MSGAAGDLRGRVAIVTGASRGIGRETSVLLAYAGASILLVARGASDLRTVADACNAAIATAGEPPSGATVSTLAIDITDDGAAERIAAAASELAAPGADILVNNAGASAIREIEEVPLADWRAAFELNVIAPKLLMDATVPAMAERGWGRVVNVASTAGKRPTGSMPEYSVAKAAQLSLSRLYADRWASAGVAINAVCPGPVKSEMWMDQDGLLDQTVAAGGHDDRDDALAAVGAKRPIGRLAEVEEIAPAIAFLCSPAASYVAGAAWSVDGGTVQVII